MNPPRILSPAGFDVISTNYPFQWEGDAPEGAFIEIEASYPSGWASVGRANASSGTCLLNTSGIPCSDSVKIRAKFVRENEVTEWVESDLVCIPNNPPPPAVMVSPEEGEVLGSVIPVAWTEASDLDSDGHKCRCLVEARTSGDWFLAAESMPSTGFVNVPAMVVGEGCVDFRVVFVDEAGLRGLPSMSASIEVSIPGCVMIDTTPPSGAILRAGGRFTQAGDLQVLMRAADGGSGIRDFRTRVGGGEWGPYEPFSGVATIPMPDGGGKVFVSVQFRDYAGNVSEAVRTLALQKVDGLGPCQGICSCGGRIMATIAGRVYDVDARTPVSPVVGDVSAMTEWAGDVCVAVPEGESTSVLRVSNGVIGQVGKIPGRVLCMSVLDDVLYAGCMDGVIRAFTRTFCTQVATGDGPIVEMRTVGGAMIASVQGGECMMLEGDGWKRLASGKEKK